MEPTSSHESLVVSGIVAKLPTVKDSTLSRLVVENPASRVVVFSFDQGQELTDHAEPTPEIWTVLDGQVSFTVDGRRTELVAGDVVYLAPGARRTVVATTSARVQHVVLPG